MSDLATNALFESIEERRRWNELTIGEQQSIRRAENRKERNLIERIVQDLQWYQNVLQDMDDRDIIYSSWVSRETTFSTKTCELLEYVLNRKNSLNDLLGRLGTIYYADENNDMHLFRLLSFHIKGSPSEEPNYLQITPRNYIDLVVNGGYVKHFLRG